MRKNIFDIYHNSNGCYEFLYRGNKVYDKYQHTPISGWEKNDTLKFEVPKMNTNGVFACKSRIRINSSFPFMGLTFIVDQTVYPSHITKSDTLNCQLIDKNGKNKGLGIQLLPIQFRH